MNKLFTQTLPLAACALGMFWFAGCSAKSSSGETSSILNTAPRQSICAVSAQNRTGQESIPMAGLDEEIRNQLVVNGFEAKTVPFGPAADVDHEARVAGCKVLLYSEVASLNKSLNGRSATAELNYRLFLVDEQRIAGTGSVKAKSTRIRESMWALGFASDTEGPSKSALAEAAIKLGKAASKPVEKRPSE